MAVNYFLRIDGVKGESQDAKHKGEIDVESWSWGESNVTASSGGSGGAGKPDISNLSVMTQFSAASPALVQACLTGQHFKSAVLSGTRAGGKSAFDFLTFTLSDVTVESIQASASSEVPSESVSLAFASFTVQYRQQQADGTPGGVTQVGWDLTQDKAA